ncbi:hypothetical protein Tco_0922419 [Tanacetum coccineum]|uniref:Uncharacterized protein n=1 Tax=Tanacetum coccineum TaxID=301880 RepID=A0ABQ5CY27_9ASTR
MAALTFADSHNMVAYMEKSEANADFAEIVDFFNASSIRYALTVFANMRRQGKDFSGTVTPLFATMLIQSQAVEGEDSGQPTEPQHTPTIASPSHSSRPTTLVADETVHKERGDSVERATTTATSLDAEQGSDCPGLEITNLKKRVKKLEKKKKSRTPQLKRRLFKVRIDSITKKSLGDQKDASKQGRNEIDHDEGISWFQEDAETPGRYGHDISTAEVSIVSVPSYVDVSAASPTRPIDDFG